jgi:hypothetical protein
LPLLSLAACSRDGEVTDFTRENDEAVKAVTGAPDATAARKAWDAHKDSLKAKATKLADIRGFQVQKETMAAMSRSVMDGGMAICGLQLKHIGDADGGAAFKGICDEYTASLQM